MYSHFTDESREPSKPYRGEEHSAMGGRQGGATAYATLVLAAGLGVGLAGLNCGRPAGDPAPLPTAFLEEVPVPASLAGPLAASRRAATTGAGDAQAPLPALAADHDWAGQLDWRREQADLAAQACADLLARWRREPQRFLWIETALNQHHADLDSAGVAGLLAQLPAGGPARRFAEALSIDDPAQRDSLLCLPEDAAALRAEDRLLRLRLAGRAMARRGQPGAAAEALTAALPQARALGGPFLEARFWEALAGIHSDQGEDGDLDAAVHALQRAYELYQASGAPHWRLLSAAYLGRTCVERRELGRALALFTWTQTRAQAERARYAESYALNGLSPLYLDLGEVERALACDRRALDLLRQTGNLDDLPYLHLNLADDFVMLAQLDSARVMMDAAHAAARASRVPGIRWAVYLDDADLTLLSGDFARADSLRRLAAGEGIALRSPYDERLRLLRLAEHGLITGRLALVEEALAPRNGESAAPRGSSAEDLVFETALLRARLYLAGGERPAAAAALDSCARCLASLPAAERSARFLAQRGRLLAASGDALGALAAQSAALDSARASGRPALVHRQQLLLGQAQLAAGHPAQAREQFREASNLLGQAMGLRTLQERDYWLARCAEAEGDAAAASRQLRRLLAEEAQALPQDLRVLALVALGRVETARGQRPSALAAYQSALALIGDGSRHLERPELRYAASELLRETICALVRLELAGRPDADAVARSLGLRQQLLDLPAGRGAAPASWPRTPTLALLLDDTESRAWVLHDGRARSLALPGRARLEALATRVRAGCERPERQADAAAAAELAELLLAPLGEDWPRGATLQVLADGALQGLPWALLPWGAASCLEHGPLVEIPSLRCGENAPAALPLLPLVAFGSNAAAGPGKPALTHAETEAKELAAVWPHGQAVPRSAITAAAILAAGREPGLIHLVMHGTPGRWSAGQTALALPNGGQLEARQVAQSRWRSALITLSACETRRDGGGHDDLPQAFLAGGAQAVLASSLRVPDDAGRLFMLALYERLRAGLAAEEALRLTQLEQAGGPPERAAPYFWSGYRVIRQAR
jgi:CHAT domain-containing protein